jgi:endonuclease III-like uncharacterized protein
MDELGSNLAGEATEMVSEPAVNTTSELRKRRSTRIVQAVPLQVTGVDALGRPFMERTSSLILNCHGCRYQSKHYVLKNMWVKLEVPNPEADQPPRTVRGRVAWIQRPRTVRQLFQVALELETPGNVWGIGFPPEDWFGFSDPGKAQAATATAPAVQGSFPAAAQAQQATPAAAPAQTSASETEFHVSLTEPGPASSTGPDNVRVFPSPASTTDASLQLARHVTRLMNEARQQIQAAVRDAASHAVADERRASAEQWEQKIAEGREELSRMITSALKRIQDEATERTRSAHEAAAAALQEELPKQIASQLEELSRKLSTSISEEGLWQRAAHEQQLAGAVETLQASIRQAEEAAAQLRRHEDDSAARMAARAEGAQRTIEDAARQREETANTQRDTLAAAVNEAQQQLASSVAGARENWQTHLTTELEAAQARWQMTAENAFAGAQERASGLLNERANAATSELQQEAERLRESLHRTAGEVTERAGAVTSVLQQEIERLRDSLQKATGESTDRVNAVTSELQQETERLRESLHRAAGEAGERANTITSELQQEAERLRESLRKTVAEAAEGPERRAAELHESLRTRAEQIESALTRAGEASERLENFSARLETVQQQALSVFQSQADDVLSLHRNELHRRSESIFEEIASRIRGAFDESSAQAVSAFSQQVEAMMQPQIASADEAMQRLAGGKSLLEAALTLHQERIRSTTDEAFAEALANFQGNLGSVEEIVRGSAEAVTARSLSELETKVHEVKHQAVEDLIKSAEWYEKKAQTQIQGAAEKIAEQSTNHLRDKAREITGEFSAEMGQSSRNFISYAQTQMADVVSEAFDKARNLFAEAAETTSAAFVDEIQRHARQDLDGFEAEIQKSGAEARSQLEAAHAELAQRVTGEQEEFLRRFQSSMNAVMEEGIADANQRVQAGFEPLLKSWKSMTEAHQTEMYDIYTKLGEQAAEQYRARLDNVSNQWMLATVSSLDHQSRDAIAKIAANAEENLRETCTKVFADIGEALRERLQQIASNLNAPAKGATP